MDENDLTTAGRQTELLREILGELRHINRRLDVIESMMRPVQVFRGGPFLHVAQPHGAVIATPTPTTGTPPAERPTSTC